MVSFSDICDLHDPKLITSLRRGRLVKDRASGQPKLTCRNWECGVLIPMDSQAAAKSGWSVFENRIPVPMVVPGEAYGKTNSKRPWLFLES